MADFEFDSLVLESETPPLDSLDDKRAALHPIFLALVRELYPHGRAWTKDPTSVTYKLLDGIADALVDLDIEVATFRREANPAFTSQLLDEWEEALGLPDPCLGSNATEEARRGAIIARLVGLQGASTSELLAFLAGLGYSVSFKHFAPYRVGSAVAGDLLWGTQWQFVLGVHYWGSGDRARLECALRHRMPAQVTVVFYYGETYPADLFDDLVVPPLQFIF